MIAKRPHNEADRPPLSVLIVEDNPGDADLIHETLDDISNYAFTVAGASRLQQALAMLLENEYDVVLLDMSLPDSHGFDTFLAVRTQVPDTPVIILTGHNDESLAFNTVQSGAQDYLLKEHLNPGMLLRVIRYAIERQKLLTDIRSLSLTDEMTGLRNRRGFQTLCEQQLKVADRIKQRMYLFFVDMDGMKWINDHLGHAVGDEAIIETAELLNDTFRKSDIIARMGGDEFVVLAVETTEASSDVMRQRMRDNLAAHNARPERKYELSISVGIECYDPENPCSMEELLEQADGHMYEHKQSRKKARTT